MSPITTLRASSTLPSSRAVIATPTSATKWVRSVEEGLAPAISSSCFSSSYEATTCAVA